MGNTWEVYAWTRVDGRLKYIQIYAGESRRAAMRAARGAKNEGCGCVKIEWRGTSSRKGE